MNEYLIILKTNLDVQVSLPPKSRVLNKTMTNKKTNNLSFKWPNDMNRHFTREYTDGL